ncbi:FAD:protein FMN transferase [Paludibacterium sp.]|uniref:FAD:protein FMN transferase n=1 Tax=Paludibacterium sp. TaxID=1917523 RepID=UPI0025D34C1A|nr:FAD:protein FMN transferase [Paludibacterium sp.]
MAVLILTAVGILTAVVMLALRTPSLYSQGTYVFGTRVQLMLYGPSLDEAQQSTSAVFDHWQQMQRTLHAWRPSEVTRLNAALADGRPFQASPDLTRILSAARALTLTSHGLFDPGIGRLIRLWGFQADQFGVTPPTHAQIRALMTPPPSLAALDISPAGRIASRQTNVAIDLGGYAKGWALDDAATLLRQRGIQNALIDVGGNLMALGSKGGEPWRVGIQDPRRAGTLATLDLRDGEAIGTSGDYQRFFLRDGQRYCHILDPRSGVPAQASESVTVLVPPGPHAGALSDGASKPPFIAGARQAMAAVRPLGVTAVLLVDAKGQVWVSPAMARRVRFTDPNVHPAILP